MKRPCYECLRKVMYLFTDGRCLQCTRVTLDDVVGPVAPGESNPPDDHA